jgi:ADP-ribose pyrophosphatase
LRFLPRIVHDEALSRFDAAPVTVFTPGCAAIVSLPAALAAIPEQAFMSDQDVEIVERSTVFQGYFRVDKYRLRHRLHAGGMSQELSREVFERGHAAGVLPYDPLNDRVVLIEQFRIGAYAAGQNPWVTEIVAGIIEAGESVEALIHREAQEEAGLEILALEPIHEYLASPGGTSETQRLYCGRVDADEAGGIHGLAEEGEDIRVLPISYGKALARLRSGEIRNASAIIALQWLALNRDRLRETWL